MAFTSRPPPSARMPIVDGAGRLTPAWHQFLVGKDWAEPVTAARIAASSDVINTTGKVEGKFVLDTTNNRLMVARGGEATDKWDIADGSASVTPS